MLPGSVDIAVAIAKQHELGRCLDGIPSTHVALVDRCGPAEWRRRPTPDPMNVHSTNPAGQIDLEFHRFAAHLQGRRPGGIRCQLPKRVNLFLLHRTIVQVRIIAHITVKIRTLGCLIRPHRRLNRRERVLVVVGIHVGCLDELPHAVEAIDLLRLALGLAQRGQQHRSQYRDNRDHH